MFDFLNSLSLISGGFVIALINLILTYFLYTKNNFYKVLFSTIISYLSSYILYWLPCMGHSNCSEHSNWEVVVVFPWFIIGFLTSISFQLILDKYKKI